MVSWFGGLAFLETWFRFWITHNTFLSTGNVEITFLPVDFLCGINLLDKDVFAKNDFAKTDFLRMLLLELSLTTKPTESQFGDLGEIHRNTSCVIRQKVLVQRFIQAFSSQFWFKSWVYIYKQAFCTMPIFGTSPWSGTVSQRQTISEQMIELWFPHKKQTFKPLVLVLI